MGGNVPLPPTPSFSYAYTNVLFSVQLPRVSNPRCALWNQDEGAWDETAVDTVRVENLDKGELKTFRVQASTNRPGAFAVLVDQDADFEVSSFEIMFITQ